MKIITGNYRDVRDECEKLYPEGYFEFVFACCDENSRFREIDRFLYESRKTLRYQREYVGNVVVDITAWNDTELNSLFDAFMYLLKDGKEKYRVAFTMGNRSSDKLLKRLNDVFEGDIQVVDLHLDVEPMKHKIGFTANVESEEEYVRK